MKLRDIVRRSVGLDVGRPAQPHTDPNFPFRKSKRDDAASIIGEDYADELDLLEKIRGKLRRVSAQVRSSLRAQEAAIVTKSRLPKETSASGHIIVQVPDPQTALRLRRQAQEQGKLVNRSGPQGFTARAIRGSQDIATGRPTMGLSARDAARRSVGLKPSIKLETRSGLSAGDAARLEATKQQIRTGQLGTIQPLEHQRLPGFVCPVTGQRWASVEAWAAHSPYAQEKPSGVPVPARKPLDLLK